MGVISLSQLLIKHLQGQHDQSTHGRRGSRVSHSESGSNSSQDSITALSENAIDINKRFIKLNIVKNEIFLTNDFKTKEEQNKVQRTIEDTYNHIMNPHNGIPEVTLFLKKHPVDNIRVSSGENIIKLAASSPEIFGTDVSRFVATSGLQIQYIKGGINWHDRKQKVISDILLSAGESKNWDEIDIIDKGGEKSITILGESARTIFRHELGHHVHNNMVVNSAGTRKKLSSLWYQHLDKNKITPDIMKKKISKYAGTNASECFSECFSLYTHPDYKSGKNRLPKEIEKFFDEHLPYRVEKSLSEVLTKYITKRSGNYGHAGRPGKVGGSVSRGGLGSPSKEKDSNYLFCGWKKDAPNKAKAFGKECNKKPEKFLKENNVNAILARNALNEYVNYDHSSINLLLRRPEINEDNVRSKEIKASVDGLDKLMNNCSTTKNIITVRSVSKDFYDRLKKKAGKHFIDKGFVSTTLTPGILSIDKSKSITIKIPKGTKAFFVDTKYRKGKNEFELLLNRGLKYQINKVGNDIELEIIG